MDAVLRLAAERGYDAATVGAIEAEAGLAPRSGALYQHFKSKDEVLAAAIDRELQAVDELAAVIEVLPLGDLRAELTLLARWNLGSLERRAALTGLVRREAHRLQPDVLDKLYGRLVDRPYELIVGFLRERFKAAGVKPPDLYALAVVLIEPMSSYRFMRETFNRTPDDLDEDRLVAAVVELAMAAAREYGLA
jgi:AcrR family transcriptional regulator